MYSHFLPHRGTDNFLLIFNFELFHKTTTIRDFHDSVILTLHAFAEYVAKELTSTI